MLSAILSRFVILLFGTLYPAYASYKAVRTKNVKEYVKWMMYWIVFAFFTCAETFTDVFLSFWFPFYYEIKVVIVVWLLSPATKGSSILYRNFVHPMLTKREQDIDEYISKAKEQGYHTMLDLGSRGVTYATNVLMQTAIKGGGGIVNQLRRSYSLSDLSEESDFKADLNRNNKLQTDSVDAHASDVLRDSRVRSSRKPVGSRIDLYFPEMDVDVRSHHSHELPISLSQIRSSEDISSGYSSAEPLFGESQAVVEGNPLVRTASVGATRPRAVRGRMAVQPKKGLTTEDERDEVTADQGWQQPLLSLPVDSLFPDCPAGSSPKAFLSPEALHLILANYINSGNVPLNTLVTNDIIEIILDDKESLKEQELFEDAEQEKSPETNGCVVMKESGRSNEDKIISGCTLTDHNTNYNEVTEGIVVKDKMVSDSVLEDKGIDVRDEDEIVIKDKDTFINDSLPNDKIMGVTEKSDGDIERYRERQMIKVTTPKNDCTIVAEKSAVKYESGNLDLKCLQLTDISNTMSKKSGYTEEAEIVTKRIVDTAESMELTQLEISTVNAEETSVNEVELIDECFEDACDNAALPDIYLNKTLTNISSLPAEIIKDTALDGLTLTSIVSVSTNYEIDETQHNSLQPTTSLESFDSGNDLNFEDTLSDVASVIDKDSPDSNDRKGKYNKTRAPPPPETTKTEEICKELQTGCPNSSGTEPDLLMGSSPFPSQDLKYKFLNEQSTDNSVIEDNLKLTETPSKNLTYEKRETSPSPSQIKKDLKYKFLNEQSTDNSIIEDNLKWGGMPSKDLTEKREVSPSPSQIKKDSSNFSRFLPKSGMSSLFSLWSSKDDASRTRRSPTRKSPTTEMLCSSPTNIAKYAPESGIHSHSLVEGEVQRKTKLKIRQMSQSPSHGRRLHNLQ